MATAEKFLKHINFSSKSYHTILCSKWVLYIASSIQHNNPVGWKLLLFSIFTGEISQRTALPLHREKTAEEMNIGDDSQLQSYTMLHLLFPSFVISSPFDVRKTCSDSILIEVICTFEEDFTMSLKRFPWLSACSHWTIPWARSCNSWNERAFSLFFLFHHRFTFLHKVTLWLSPPFSFLCSYPKHFPSHQPLIYTYKYANKENLMV